MNSQLEREQEQDYDCIQQAYDEAHLLMTDPARLADASDTDACNLLGSYTVGHKIVKVLGERYTIANALLIAACALNEEQRRTVLDDVHDAILNHIAQHIIDKRG